MNAMRLSQNKVLRALLAVLLAIGITASPVMQSFAGGVAGKVAGEGGGALFGGLAFADEGSEIIDLTPVITDSTTISAGGTYQLAPTLANATITIETDSPVTLVGNGIGDGTRPNANENVAITGSVPNVKLTIQDVFLSMTATNADIIDFAAGFNTLTIAGTNLLDYDTGYGDYCVIHVAPLVQVTINGSGTLYFYKNQAGAAIGAHNQQGNGTLIFDGPTVFGKGSKQGAVIGTGATTAGVTPGDITFLSGEYTFVANARGALIGGGAGSTGGAAGGNVYVRGGTLNLNVDYSGAAIGGGGYASGNDSLGGNVYISGGSIRTFIDYNAVFPNGGTDPGASLWAGVTQYGVNDAAITANKLDAGGEPVHLLVFDTNQLATPATSFTVTADDEIIYTGGKHHYKYINENLTKAEQLPVDNTTANWVENENEDNLYLYLGTYDHTLTVNNEVFDVVWNAEASAFTIISDTEPSEPVTLTIGYSGGSASGELSFIAGTTLVDGVLKAVPGTEVAVTPTAAAGYYAAQVRASYDGGASYVALPLANAPVYSVSSGPLYTFTVPEHDVDIQLDCLPIVWDGSIDVSWYNSYANTFSLQYPAQVAGLSAIVNGIFTTYPTSEGTDSSGKQGNLPDYHQYLAGMGGGALLELDAPGAPDETEGVEAAPQEVEVIEGVPTLVNKRYGEFTATYQLTDTQVSFNNRTAPITKTTRVVGDASFIVAHSSVGVVGSNNQVTSNDYYFGIDDFNGKKIFITADLDFGATKNGSSWDVTSPLYMPIGGQYSMLPGAASTNAYAKLGSSFCGTLDGQGHRFINVYCERYANTEFGDSQSIGLIGRLGVHDGDPAQMRPVNPTVRQIDLESGYVTGRRSIGGIVGKIGKTSAGNNDGSIGGIIEFCINKATVKNTDSKGLGGIVGSSWNGGLVQHCANFGTITSTYSNPTAGIAGSNEVTIRNCYNVGTISASSSSYAMAIGTNNGGGINVTDCYWLTGSAPGGGYYGGGSSVTVYEFGPGKTIETLTATQLNVGAQGIWANDTTGINAFNGVNYPVLYFQNAGYDPWTNYTVSLTQPTAGATLSANPTQGEVGTTITLDVELELGWLLDYFTVDGVRIAGKSFVLGSNVTASAVVRQVNQVTLLIEDTTDKPYNLSVTKTGIALIDGTLTPVTGYTVAQGDTVYEGDVLTYTGTLKPEAAPSDPNLTYSGSFSYTSSFRVNGDTPPTTTMGATLELTQARTAGFDNVTVSAVPLTTAKTWAQVADVSWYDSSAPQTSYLLTTAAQLAGVAKLVNDGVTSFEGVTLALANDISLANADGTDGARQWVAAGTSATKAFKGSFDGDGNHITNLTADFPSSSYVALFGYTQAAVVKNLTVAGVVNGGSYVAGIVAYANATNIKNCVNEANITARTNYAGGIVGYSLGVTAIEDSTNKASVLSGTAAPSNVGGIAGYVSTGATVTRVANTATITAGSNVGGIVGNLAGATINSASNTGNLSGRNGSIGGIVGLSAAGTVFNTYNRGSVTGEQGASNVGGILGRTDGASNLSNSYTTGTVTNNGTGYAGAVGGYVYQTTARYTNVHYLAGVTGVTSNELVNGFVTAGNTSVTATANTSAELKTRSATLGDAFKTAPEHYNDAYPVLVWQTIPSPPYKGLGPGSGDIDEDGHLTMGDVVLVLRAVTGNLSGLTPSQRAAADIDQDGYLAMGDLVSVLRKAMRL